MFKIGIGAGMLATACYLTFQVAVSPLFDILAARAAGEALAASFTGFKIQQEHVSCWKVQGAEEFVRTRCQ